MDARSLLLFTLACTFSFAATAQWQWMDKEGRKVFSDRPPPQEVPEKNIVQRPRGMVAPKVGSTAPAATEDATGKTAAATAGSGKDAELEANKAKAEAAEKMKKEAADKAQAQKTAQLRADNCRRAQQASSSLESGRLMSHVNARGERVFMDEATRAAETARAQQIIRDNCAQ